jgi:hypothetical protein
MKRFIAQILSVLALVITIGAPSLFFYDQLGMATMQQWLLGATVLWFMAAPCWMEHKTA